MDAYSKALQEEFDSKTPAQHLADSKYMGRGLTKPRSFYQLRDIYSSPKGPLLFSVDMVDDGKSPDVAVFHFVYTRSSVEAATRLTRRARRGQTIKKIQVTRILKS